MQIYHNPRCSKSRQTLQILNEHHVDVEIIEYLKTPPSVSELTQLIKLLGIPALDLIRKNEEAAKGIDLNAMNEAELIALMCEHPKLIERPIVFDATRAIIGRPPENVKELIA